MVESIISEVKKSIRNVMEWKFSIYRVTQCTIHSANNTLHNSMY